MEHSIAITLMGMLVGTVALSQTSESTLVKETITAFAKAADNSDAADMEQYLDENFRIVMNRLFGSNTVNIMPREVYLEKIRTKEFGGENRKIQIEEVIMNGATACAKVTFQGAKMTFVSLMTLIKSESGTWKLVSDVPTVK